MTNAEAWFNNSLRPRKPEGSLGRTAQDVHLDSHTAPELCHQSDVTCRLSTSFAWKGSPLGCDRHHYVIKGMSLVTRLSHSVVGHDPN